MNKTLSYLLFIVCGLCVSECAMATVELDFNLPTANQMTTSYDKETKIYTFKTTGEDPYIQTTALTRNLQEGEDHLYLEYKSTKQLDAFQIFFGNTWAENRSYIVGNVAAADDWTILDVSLLLEMSKISWGLSGQKLRLDFGRAAGATVQVRNLCIYDAQNEEEKEEWARKKSLNESLGNYLSKSYPCEVTYVEVGKNNVTVKGTLDREDGYALVEVPPYADVAVDTAFVFQQEIAGKEFEVEIPRVVTRNAFRYDRIYSKWAVVDLSNGTPQLASHARYADKTVVESSPKAMPILGKKGLGGFFVNGYQGDLDKLGIKSVTVNIVLTNLIALSSGVFSNSEAFIFGRKTYYVNKGYVGSLDQIFKMCYERGIVSSAILLVSPDAADSKVTKLLRHPEYKSGYYSMPNMTNLESTQCYAAVLSYLANRYHTAQYGRINNWIMHNEVDIGTEWTNMGDQPVNIYMDAYIKSMRLCYNIVRQYDQNAWILGSYTHDWTADGPGPGYNTRDMLKQTLAYSTAEGDFRWGLAAHPYPQDLTKPSFWTDDTQSTYTMGTPYVTFKNLEVLNAWALTKENFYQGKEKRLLFLSENGTNSPDYSEQQLKLQAAGACWAWKKVNRLDGIDGIQWHNWIDNRAEFGLRIGLRRFPDDETEPGGPKPVWYVWQAADTEQEEEVFKPYLKTLGVTSWNRIFHGNLTPVEDIQEEEALGSDAIYTTSGLRVVGKDVNDLSKGLYIFRQGGRTKKILKR